MFIINLIRFADRNTFFCCFIISLVIFTRNTFWYVWLEMSIFWTSLTFVSKLIPNWSFRWASLTRACCTINNRLISRTCFTYLIDWVPSWFIFWTHTDACTSFITWSDRSKTYTLIGILIKFISNLTCAYSLTKRKNWPIRASKTSVINFVSVWSFDWACSHVELSCLCKDYEPVLLLSNVSINPVWRSQIILVQSIIQINQSSCLLRSNDSWNSFAVTIYIIIHDRQIKLCSSDLVNQLIRDCTLVSRLFSAFSYLGFHVKQWLICDFNLFINFCFFLFCEVGFWTRFECIRLIE